MYPHVCILFERYSFYATYSHLEWYFYDSHIYAFCKAFSWFHLYTFCKAFFATYPTHIHILFERYFFLCYHILYGIFMLTIQHIHILFERYFFLCYHILYGIFLLPIQHIYIFWKAFFLLPIHSWFTYILYSWKAFSYLGAKYPPWCSPDQVVV